MKENTSPKAILRSDYEAPEFWVDDVTLYVLLNEDVTLVTCEMNLRRNPEAAATHLHLDGSHQKLVSLNLDGELLQADAYELDDAGLTLRDVPDAFQLTVTSEIEPQNNTALEGLYKSSGNYCTQCEAQGFRRITYYPDRPDVMARFTVTVDAAKDKYPVLLSNGNPISRRDLDGGRHSVTWEDPFPKPSYLFALVAGDLACVRDTFTTMSGREVSLEIYVEHHNADKCDHAMRSLKKAMRWDEERFGLEYDLDIYMIVAVDDFNMGAMENKGLNVFNSKFVLANQATATDMDFQNIEGVIAHEYFHNWTGNRVTCRDWFQLSLKEGLTVFRDQEFSSDMNSRAVKRIEDVRLLRARQFPEDAGPTAHPIRPDSYIEINNFYTLTVYEKGSEVIRVLHTILGEENFRKGMDLYFERHDGQAVTCEDFVAAMEDASGIDLRTARQWYSQAGTPDLTVAMDYDAARKTCALKFSQKIPPTPGQSDKNPTHIPVKLALFASDGKPLPFSADGKYEYTFDVTGESQSFTLEGVDAAPVPSLLRGFSAPVNLHYDYSDEDLAFLMAHEDDSFNRWDAGQKLALRVALALLDNPTGAVPKSYIEACAAVLSGGGDDALIAEALHLPGEEVIGEACEAMDIAALHAVREKMLGALATRMQPELISTYHRCTTDGEFSVDATAIGQRSLKNTCLGLLKYAPGDEGIAFAKAQFESASNMTDEIAALRILCDAENLDPQPYLAAFYEKWRSERLVIDKWFSIQSMSRRADTLSRVKTLTSHTDFEMQNPNRVRSLLGAFAMSNPVRFHAPDGEAYTFFADHIIELDKINPQVAARMVSAMSRWRRYAAPNCDAMKVELERIRAVNGISNDVFELVDKSLQ
ncbi:MAG: aminopeptidase N [Pseudomonadota bacterium]